MNGPEPPSGEHIVLVRNQEGNVIHTHEVIYFGAEPLSETSIQEEALAAARAHHPRLKEDLSASMSTRTELERLRVEAATKHRKG